jgi:uncharacterized membrane protein YhaH (DUF805 family)
MGALVFISYRRDDSQHAVGRLYERLTPRYLAPAEVFMDTEAIAAGADFPLVLKQHLSHCKVCLVVIGPRWIGIRDKDDRRRLELPADQVRQEVLAALSDPAITVIPVLLDDTKMPGIDQLPEPLQPLATRNAVRLVADRFGPDVDALAAAVLRALGRSEDPELELIKLLFSFKGTISRKRYWIGSFLVAVTQVLVIAVQLWISGADVLTGLLRPLEIDRQHKLILQLTTLWYWWPVLALSWKRVKDLGHGWGLFCCLLAADILQLGFDLAGQETEALVMSIICLLSLAMLGTLRGTRFVAHGV